MVFSLAMFAYNRRRWFFLQYLWYLNQYHLAYLTVSHKFRVNIGATGTLGLGIFDRNRRDFLTLAAVGAGIYILPDLTLTSLADPILLKIHDDVPMVYLIIV